MQWDMPSMWGAECRYQMAVLLWMWQNINLVLIISGSRKHLITEGRVSIVNSIWDYKLSELRLKTRFSCCRLPLLYSPIYKCSVGNPGALWCKSCNECFHLMRISEKSLNTASMTRQRQWLMNFKVGPPTFCHYVSSERCIGLCSRVMQPDVHEMLSPGLRNVF